MADALREALSAVVPARELDSVLGKLAALIDRYRRCPHSYPWFDPSPQELAELKRVGRATRKLENELEGLSDGAMAALKTDVEDVLSTLDDLLDDLLSHAWTSDDGHKTRGRPHNSARAALVDDVAAILHGAGVRVTRYRDGVGARVLKLIFEQVSEPFPVDPYQLLKNAEARPVHRGRVHIISRYRGTIAGQAEVLPREEP